MCDFYKYFKSKNDYYKSFFKFISLFGVDILWKLKWLDLFDELFRIEQETDYRKKLKLFDDCGKKIKKLPLIYEPVKNVASGFFYTNELEERARLITALIAIKIERYRLKYHKLPKDLNALVPEFFEKLPVDPFSGKSYKYRIGKFDTFLQNTFYHSIEKKLEGFIVYSIGKNGVDDNGKADDQHGDIVYWVVNKAKNQNINEVLGVKKKDK